MRDQILAVPRNDRGVALPLALIGLISVSLLVTTALVTSSTELAISNAHQDATESLYDAEGALNEYTGLKRAESAAGGTGMAAIVDDELIENHLITVTEMFSRIDTIGGNQLRQLQTYGLLAEPSSGRGRVISAVAMAQRSASMIDITVDAGLSVGGDVQVTGNSTISDGTGALCDSAIANNALQVSVGSSIEVGGSSTIIGGADTASYSKEQMVETLLGGMTIDEAARYATIKFAAGEFKGRVRSYDSTTPRPKTDKYNWGCPATSADPCTLVLGNTANTTYYPTVVIDAGGGTVTLEGDHGQGVLLIQNGNLNIKGNFVYQGIVLVESDLNVAGTGGTGGVKIEGAVVALGENSTVEDNATGNSVITYNKCIINAAEAGANADRLNGSPQTFPFGVLGFLEVVR